MRNRLIALAALLALVGPAAGQQPPAQSYGLDLAPNNSLGVAGSNRARIRYNSGTGTLQSSINGGSWSTLGGGGGGGGDYLVVADTAALNAISSPVAGMLAYVQSPAYTSQYSGSQWGAFTLKTASGDQSISAILIQTGANATANSQGQGGVLSIVAGNGAATTSSSFSAGAGGDINITAGTSGAASNGGTAAVEGGSIFIIAGGGSASSAGSDSGIGGEVDVFGGHSGANSTLGDDGIGGGPVTIGGGTGGSSNGGAGGAGGDVTLHGGSYGSGATHSSGGNVFIFAGAASTGGNRASVEINTDSQGSTGNTNIGNYGGGGAVTLFGTVDEALLSVGSSTTSYGVNLSALTPALAGNQLQNSPTFRLTAHSWKTGGTGAVDSVWDLGARAATSASAPRSSLAFHVNDGGGGTNDTVFSLSDNGVLTLGRVAGAATAGITGSAGVNGSSSVDGTNGSLFTVSGSTGGSASGAHFGGAGGDVSIFGGAPGGGTNFNLGGAVYISGGGNSSSGTRSFVEINGDTNVSTADTHIGNTSGGTVTISGTFKVGTVQIDPSSPSSNNVLKWNGSAFVAGTVPTQTKTLHQAYADGTGVLDSVLNLDSTRGKLLFQDNGTPIGTLTEWQTSASISLLKVDASNLTLGAGFGLTTAAGSSAINFGSATGAFTFPTGNVSDAGASTKTVSLVTTGSGSTITLTAGAASTWGTSAGALNLDGFAGINLKTNGVLVADIGATASTDLTMAASKNISFATDNSSNVGASAKAAAAVFSRVLDTGSANNGAIRYNGGAALGWSSSTLFPAGGAATYSIGGAGLEYTGMWSYTFRTVQQTQTASGAVTFNSNTGGSTQRLLANGNVTGITVTAPTTGNSVTITIFLKQNSAGTATWPTTMTNVIFAGGTFSKTTAANAIDAYHLVWSTDDSKWVCVGFQLNLS